MSRVVSYANADMMMTALAGIVAGQLQSHIDDCDHATLAVPGGTTPGPMFDVLCQADIDWAKVTVMLTDERWVSESSERSNIALIRTRLLQGPAQAATFVGFDAVEATPEEGFERLVKSVTPHLPLTVCVLGMGTDMHTASLFPGADRLLDGLAPDAPPVLPMRAKGADEPRITLTAPVLQGARHLHILLLGQAKKDALAQAQKTDGAELAPVRVILDRADVHITL